jgi:hypothetical protein
MEQNKLPRCPMIGADGNIFNILGLAAKTLKSNSMADKVNEMMERAKVPGNDYNKALVVVMEYVEPVSTDEPNDLYGPNPEGRDEDCDLDEDCEPGYGHRLE